MSCICSYFIFTGSSFRLVLRSYKLIQSQVVAKIGRQILTYCSYIVGGHKSELYLKLTFNKMLDKKKTQNIFEVLSNVQWTKKT
jgi:hypothetical protein